MKTKSTKIRIVSISAVTHNLHYNQFSLLFACLYTYVLILCERNEKYYAESKSNQHVDVFCKKMIVKKEKTPF
jgi:hypothetical protein